MKDFVQFLWRHFEVVSRDATNEPRKVKDSTEKCSVITLLTGILNSIPIGLINCDVLDHGALLSTIFNFANGSLVARS